MGKLRMNTKKHIARARRRAAEELKAEQVVADTGFRWRHDDQMRRMMRDVDLERYEELGGE